MQMMILAQKATSGITRISERAKPSEISEKFRDGEAGSQIPVDGILLAAGVVLVIFAALSMFRWWRHRGEYSMPGMVFVKVGRGVGLSWRELLMVRRIAKTTGFGEPLAMLMARGTMRAWTEVYLQQIPVKKHDKVMQVIDHVGKKVFYDSHESIAARQPIMSKAS
ncbi:hypothetical protein [Poriferisphaera sp. WC338]|uniref:hypothetical protein n=1 Tax=Poriferisphaera sp. WC338 TaxID=3425129 RepID=UPI003D819B84